MSEEAASPASVSSRPSARPDAVPMPRANYGLPARQPAPAPGRQVMDFVTPANTRLATGPTVTPSAQPATAPTPVQAPLNPPRLKLAPAGIPEPPQKSAPVRRPVPAPTMQAKPRRWQLAHGALLLVGALLIIGGAARWISAGSTSGDTIAVGAVKANDDSTLQIQFSATDGSMHYLALHTHQPSLVPGTAVQIACLPGAPDTTARQVSAVAGARQHGEITALAGVVVVAAGILVLLVVHRFRRHKRG